MTTDPLFIIGTERSGSNLLRLILDAHPRLFVPHPPHVMHFFAPLEPLYGDLSKPGPFGRLVTDVLRLVEGHIHRWDPVPDPAAVAALSPSPDLFGVFVGLYEAARLLSGKARWGNKSTFMVHHGARVLQAFPGARLLWLVRDPRDVAVSSRDSVFSPFHPAHTAALWAQQQALALDLERAWPDAVLRVHYEALVQDPNEQIRRICAFLGEEMHPGMLAFHQRAEARRSAALSESWANTGKPVSADGVGRWRGRLTDREIGLVEALAAESMDALGYSPSRAPQPLPGTLERLQQQVSGRMDWLRVEARSLRRDRNVRARWARALLMRRIAWELRRDPPDPRQGA